MTWIKKLPYVKPHSCWSTLPNEIVGSGSQWQCDECKQIMVFAGAGLATLSDDDDDCDCQEKYPWGYDEGGEG